MIEIDFGLGKISRFKTWTGRERRLIQRIIEDDTINQDTLFDILIKGCDDTYKFYTASECYFILYSNYFSVFGDSLEIKWICDKCGTSNVNSTSVAGLLKNTRKATLESCTIGEYEFVFGTPQYSNEIMKVFESLENEADRLFLNMLLCINDVKKDGASIIFSNKLQEVEDILEGLSMANFDKLFEYYNSNVFLFIPSTIQECGNVKCKHKQEIFCDYLPKIIEY